MNLEKKRFKLIGIRPLPGCHEKFLRVLKEGRVYPLYSNYKFHHENDNDLRADITEIVVEREIGNKLYDLPHLNVNVSAVVGKNGTGKSTLIELFFAAIFVLGVSMEKLKPNIKSLMHDRDDLDKEKARLEANKLKLQEKEKQLRESLNDFQKKKGNDSDYINLKELFAKLFTEDEKYKEEEYLSTESELNIEDSFHEIHRLDKDVKVEVYYELDGHLFCLQIGKKDTGRNDVELYRITKRAKESNVYVFSKDPTPIDFDQFFYSIAISYSHYALNSHLIGTWINSLFHKNDGYQTPLVINPMRTEGNININTENELVKQRILVNILQETNAENAEDTLRNLAPSKIAHRLELTFDSEKAENYIERRGNSKRVYPKAEFLNKLCLEYVGSANFGLKKGDQVFEAVKFYIENKLMRMCERYDRYKRYIKNGDFRGDDRLIKLICTDNSHITFKLKQALNFLILAHFPISDRNKFISEPLDNYTAYIQSGKEQAELFKKKPTTIELLPPSIFRIDIIMEDGTNINDLSSGEKQQIHSTSSIVYHLINLNSVSQNGEDKFNLDATLIKKYRYVNILFDEVEQYFHPDLQRTFLSDLLNYMGRMNRDHVKHVDGINILFVSHSPFIISDLLNTNCLFLELDKDDLAIPVQESIQSFGANINDMLKKNFFMSSSMGEFTRKKVEELITFYKNSMTLNGVVEYKQKYLERKAEFTQLVDLIGEPVVRGILQNHLRVMNQRFLGGYVNEEIAGIEEQIKQLQIRLSSIRKESDNDPN